MFAKVRELASDSTFGLDATSTLAGSMLLSVERLAAMALRASRVKSILDKVSKSKAA